MGPSNGNGKVGNPTGLSDGSVHKFVQIPEQRKARQGAFVILYKYQRWHAARLLSIADDSGGFYCWVDKAKARSYAAEHLDPRGEGVQWIVVSVDDLWEYADATFRLVDKT